VLTIDITKISNEESVFLARLADILINILDAILESLEDQLLANSRAIDSRISSGATGSDDVASISEVEGRAFENVDS